MAEGDTTQSRFPCGECEFNSDPLTCLEVRCPFSEEGEFKGACEHIQVLMKVLRHFHCHGSGEGLKLECKHCQLTFRVIPKIVEGQQHAKFHFCELRQTLTEEAILRLLTVE